MDSFELMESSLGLMALTRDTLLEFDAVAANFLRADRQDEIICI